MKIIITESQNKILWLRRRLGVPEIMDTLKDIVIEGFDYTNPCDYGTYNSYETNVVNGSVITFINSYFDLRGGELFGHSPLESFVAKVIIGKHRNRIQREYRDRYCVEDEDDDESDY